MNECVTIDHILIYFITYTNSAALSFTPCMTGYSISAEYEYDLECRNVLISIIRSSSSLSLSETIRNFHLPIYQ